MGSAGDQCVKSGRRGSASGHEILCASTFAEDLDVRAVPFPPPKKRKTRTQQLKLLKYVELQLEQLKLLKSAELKLEQLQVLKRLGSIREGQNSKAQGPYLKCFGHNVLPWVIKLCA